MSRVKIPSPSTVIVILLINLMLLRQISAECTQLKLQHSEKSQANIAALNSLPANTRNAEHSVKAGEYTYIMQLCPDNAVGGDFGAIIQRKEGRKDTILGRMNETDVQKSSLGDMLVLAYTNGDDYPHACNKSERRAVTLVRCHPDVDTPSLRDISENVGNEEDFCMYLFELILPPGYLAPVLTNCNNKADASSTVHHLGAGSIILLLILLPALLFFVLGAAYKRFVMGATGVEQIPGIDFWRSCAVLQSAGWRMLTGRGRSRSAYDYTSVATDEEREVFDTSNTRPNGNSGSNDDHLLPM